MARKLRLSHCLLFCLFTAGRTGKLQCTFENSPSSSSYFVTDKVSALLRRAQNGSESCTQSADFARSSSYGLIIGGSSMPPLTPDDNVELAQRRAARCAQTGKEGEQHLHHWTRRLHSAIVIDRGAPKSQTIALRWAAPSIGMERTIFKPPPPGSPSLFRIYPFPPLGALFCIVCNQLAQFYQLFLNGNDCIQPESIERLLSGPQKGPQLRNQVLSALLASSSHLSNLKQTSSQRQAGRDRDRKIERPERGQAARAAVSYSER